MANEEKIEALRQRYVAAMHGVQSGVAHVMHSEPAETTPKHLRVGVNSAMCDSAALAKLLIAKGVITELEYVEAVTVEMEAERGRYEARLSQGGVKVTLG